MKKSNLLRLLWAVLVVMLLPVVNAFGQEAYAVFEDGTLTLKYDNQRPNDAYDIRSNEYNGWSNIASDITKVVFDDSFEDYPATSCAYWFYECTNLTEIVGMKDNLNTANVTDMSCMFAYCSKLSTLDLSGFDTKNVTNMSSMFYDCKSVTSLDLSGFDTQNVTNIGGMFFNCGSLTTLDLSGFDTKNVTDMTIMFKNCSGLTTLDLSGFDTQNVISMSYMFSGCSSLTSLDLSGFDTKNVTYMHWMFFGCSSLTSLDVSRFDTQNVTNMSCMFDVCTSLSTLDVSNFNTSKVTNMESMFGNCYSLTNLDLSSFDTQNVKNMGWIFNSCRTLTNIDLSGFDTQNVTNMLGMFSGCSSLTSLDLSGFDTKNVTNMGCMFYGCSSLTTLDLSGFDTQNVTNMKEMFNNCSVLETLDVSGFDIQNVKDISYMFFYCGSLTTLDVSGFDTKNVSNMECLFTGCRGLTTLDVSGFDTHNVTNMERMFSGCSCLTTLDVSKFDTKNVTNMEKMFSGCSGLTTLDVSKFDTQNVTNMAYMFDYCKGLTTLEVSRFDTKNVTNMTYMFYYCKGLTILEVSGFDTQNVTNMSYMFYNCSKLTSLDLSGFDTQNVTNMSSIFSGCSKLKTIYVGDYWTTDNVTDSYRMFDRCYKLYGSKGTTIYECQSKPWDSQATDKTYAKIDGGETAPGYLTKSGEEPFVSDAYAILDNGTLTFYYGQNKPDNALEIGEVAGEEYYSNWKSNVSKVVFNESFKNYKPKHTKNWFQSCDNLTEIQGMKENLNTSEVKNMSGMFWHCSKLTSIDLSAFNTKNVTRMDSMFSWCNSIITLDLSGFDTKDVTSMSEMFMACSKLKTIYVGNNWATDNVTKSWWMFYGCDNLIGGKGTVYNSQNTEKQYAIIDGGESAPGYLTKLVPISIAIETTPQTEYIEGEELNITDGELLVTYNNSKTEKVELSKATISGFDNTKIGEQIIKVSFLDLETEFKIIVAATSPVSIEISTLPTKLEYIIKEDLDLTGGELLVTYNNSTTEKVELGKAIISGFDNKKFGEQTIKVSYLGLETSFIVSIAIKPIAIAIAYYPQISYVEGENFSPANGSLRVIYNNSKIDTVALSVAVVEGYNPKKIGEQTLTISYLNLTTELKVNVNPKQNINPYLEPKLVVNIYYISSFEELFWFMFDVNHGDVKANAALVNDIIINKDCLKRITAMLNTTSKAAAAFATWQPIGTSENPYQGTFDGQGHTISGLYIDDNTTNNVGLFGNVAPEAVIKNLGVTDSYIAGNENVGAICGKSEGTVVNCYTVSEVKGSKNVNPLVGAKETAAVVENCYYLAETPVANDPCAKTAEEFKSGEVAKLLAKGATINGVTYSGETFAGVTELPGTDIIPQPENNDNPSTPVSSISENNIKVWSYNHTIYIENAPADTKYTIIDLNGRVITTSTTKSTKEEVNINKSGVVIVNLGNQSFKVSL